MKRTFRWILVGAALIILFSYSKPEGGTREPASVKNFLRSCWALFGDEESTSDVETFLTAANAHRNAVNDDDLTLEDFFPNRSIEGLHLSKFNSLGDTFEHSELIASALRLPHAIGVSTVIDFFCGSSIPTLRILSGDERMRKLHVVAVDYDVDAVRVSQENAMTLNLIKNYDFHPSDAITFLKSSMIRKDTLVALNPPYLPMPPDLKDPFFATINGGTDGTKFLIPFLEYPYEKGTLVALTWSSLSNPSRIIDLIKRDFEVVYAQSYETEFGIYTTSPQLLPYLMSQRSAGKASFTDHGKNQHSYTIIGTVLRKK